MKIIDLKLIEYKRFLQIQNYLHSRAIKNSSNYLIFASHYPIFTKGLTEKGYPFALQVDRGGSITYFDEGSFMIYFIFKVNNPPLFFKKIIKILKKFFSPYPQIKYDYKKAGFYIENRKICSLGFSYKKGYSKHGVSIHLNTDLKNFNSVTPCNLKGIIATSLYNENILIDKNNIKIRLTNLIKEEFNETESQSTTK